MRMGTITLFCAFCLGVPAQSQWLKDRPEVWWTLVAQTRSSIVEERIAAFRELSAVADPGDAAYAEVLFELRDRENSYIEELSYRQEAPGEAWGDPYYTGLTVAAMRVYDKNPTHERFRILANGSYNPGSLLADQLAKTAGPHLEWLAAMATQHRNQYRRTNGLGLLAAWLRNEHGTPAQTAMAWRVLRAGLRDSSVEVQGAVSYLLERSERQEGLSLLEEDIAERVKRKQPDPTDRLSSLKAAAARLRAKLAEPPPAKKQF